ncbi:MAG: hypothetical protein WBM87_12755, partial [Woeseiaceae bacterium]
MGKNIGAGIVGVVIAIALVWLIEMVGHSVYPPPPNLDFADADAMRDYMSTLPIGAFLFVGGAWFVATLCGTFAACKIGTAKPIVFASVVGGLMLIATAANLLMIPHPLWFSILGVVGII